MVMPDGTFVAHRMDTSCITYKGFFYDLYSTKFSVMPDLIRHPEKPVSLIHLDSAALHFVPGLCRNDDTIKSITINSKYLSELKTVQL